MRSGGRRSSKAWREQRALRDVMVFLQAHGASPSLAMRIVRRYGAAAMTIVSRDPYRLALDVNGVGFKTADRIAAAIGVARGLAASGCKPAFSRWCTT